MKLTDMLKDGEFLISAELVPPLNGVPLEEEILPLADTLKNYVKLISVTEGALGSLRGGTTALSHRIK